ncbi:DUF2590 family protein [Maridesulfovibrio ferrireducens]|uniref:DUF2590 family protein n=1 Tax=Maridesulfovibrio ferrireducens TaxID=246191 RepID=UPI001A1E4F5E|nr:DUF2590 family protein [Maridesulfovibrio ferrireducens]MBI9109912.1 DUF2590 family protein [Maridesulfovibrio ferrireducens]
MYFDILISENDITLDAGGNPEKVTDLACIAQDLLHMIRDTGLLVELVANRDKRVTAENLIKIIIEVEDDERIVPGTCQIVEVTGQPGTFNLTAIAYDFGELGFSIEV